MRRRVGWLGIVCCLTLLAGCTGGQETEAQTLDEPQAAAAGQGPSLDAANKLEKISPAIPFYTGASYRADLTRRDAVMVKQQFGPGSEVFTLGTDDSFPQVYHYYVTYLAQFRAYNPPNPLPPENQEWRSLEIHLNQAMQDPFIPGDTLAAEDKHVILQISETEAEPETVIRYIVTPEPPAEPVALQ